MGNTKPAILCFHGSGSNSTIFTVQMARLTRLLRPHFTLHYLDGAHPGPAGPGVLPFFEGCGPYFHWVPQGDRIAAEDGRKGLAKGRMSREVETALKRKVDELREDGEVVVGVVGFSQGTRVASGLLQGQEVREKLRSRRRAEAEKAKASGKGDANGFADAGFLSDDAEDWDDLLNIRFAVNFCGSYPPPLVAGSTLDLLTDSEKDAGILEEKIRIPTLHVQAKQDEWAWAGKIMIDEVYPTDGWTSTVIDVDCGHHLPVKPEETQAIADEMLRIWATVRDE